jgi:hypothetical protein
MTNQVTTMRSLLTALVLLTPLLANATAASPSAPTSSEGGHVPVPGAPATPAIQQPLPDIPGVVSWNTLAKVKQIKTKTSILPEFSKEIIALNEKDVKVQGYMMPLEPGDKQKHFLLSVNSPSCSFCLPAGPEGVVEVKTKTGVKYTFEPITLTGKMSVLKSDPQGLYYRLSDASPITLK